jgi:hypothetical protein
MIDPFTALAAVQTAVKLVKKTIEVVKDVESLGPVLGKYFDAKSKAIEVIKTSKNGSFKGSALGQAIELELAIEQAIQFEKQVEMLFFQSNKMDIWFKIKERAMAIEREYAQEQNKIKLIAKRRKQKFKEKVEITIVVLIATFVITFIGVSAYEVTTYCKDNICGYK